MGQGDLLQVPLWSTLGGMGNQFLFVRQKHLPVPRKINSFFYAFGRQVSAKISARSPEKLIPFLSANISAGMHGEIRPLFFSVLFLVAANGLHTRRVGA